MINWMELSQYVESPSGIISHRGNELVLCTCPHIWTQTMTLHPSLVIQKGKGQKPHN